MFVTKIVVITPIQNKNNTKLSIQNHNLCPRYSKLALMWMDKEKTLCFQILIDHLFENALSLIDMDGIHVENIKLPVLNDSDSLDNI